MLAARPGVLADNSQAAGEEADSFRRGGTNEAHAVVAYGGHADC
jgi:hypothetical protein